jgi:hypothetical protein
VMEASRPSLASAALPLLLPLQGEEVKEGAAPAPRLVPPLLLLSPPLLPLLQTTCLGLPLLPSSTSSHPWPSTATITAAAEVVG